VRAEQTHEAPRAPLQVCWDKLRRESARHAVDLGEDLDEDGGEGQALMAPARPAWLAILAWWMPGRFAVAAWHCLCTELCNAWCALQLSGRG